MCKSSTTKSSDLLTLSLLFAYRRRNRPHPLPHTSVPSGRKLTVLKREGASKGIRYGWGTPRRSRGRGGGYYHLRRTGRTSTDTLRWGKWRFSLSVVRGIQGTLWKESFDIVNLNRGSILHRLESLKNGQTHDRRNRSKLTSTRGGNQSYTLTFIETSPIRNPHIFVGYGGWRWSPFDRPVEPTDVSVCTSPSLS